MPLIVIGLLAWVVTKAITDGRIDHTYARQGLVSPRLEAKYGGGRAAREATDGYGLFGHIRAAWLDYWPRRTEALKAARDAKAANPGEPVSWRDRWAAATQKVLAVGRKLVEPVPTRAERQAAEVIGEPVEPGPAPALAVDTGDVPPGTVQFTDTGREQWDGGRWETYDNYPQPAVDDQPEPDTTLTPTTVPTTGGPTMTAPTGEAVNYETTVAELEALANEQRDHIDHCKATLDALQQAKQSINNMQESYRAASAAAASMSDHLGAMNLDGTTMANAGTTADAMPAGVVDEMYDQLEAMETQAQERLTDAEAALAATEANLQHVQATYGDAHETVAGNLSGDASFLHSGGPSATSAQPAQVNA